MKMKNVYLVTVIVLVALLVIMFVDFAKKEPEDAIKFNECQNSKVVKSSEYIQKQNETTQVFQLSEYQDEIKKFSSNKVVGKISNVEEAIENVEKIWVEIYGDVVKDQQPYQYFYDVQQEVWLITGTLPPDMLGGVVNALIKKNTGEVLAIWHEK